MDSIQCIFHSFQFQSPTLVLRNSIYFDIFNLAFHFKCKQTKLNNIIVLSMAIDSHTYCQQSVEQTIANQTDIGISP